MNAALARTAGATTQEGDEDALASARSAMGGGLMDSVLAEAGDSPPSFALQHAGWPFMFSCMSPCHAIATIASNPVASVDPLLFFAAHAFCALRSRIRPRGRRRCIGGWAHAQVCDGEDDRDNAC